jgi:NagD protein
MATAEFIATQSPGCTAYVIGEAALSKALYDHGIYMNDVNPDYVVVGEPRAYTLESLTRATNLVLAGARLIGANSDASGPVEGGVAPACRALIAPIEIASGTRAYFCGKPNPLMMRTGLDILGCHAREAVMVGDRMDTDIIAGMEAGMTTVLVLSGVTSQREMERCSYQPDIVLEGVGAICKSSAKQSEYKEAKE